MYSLISTILEIITSAYMAWTVLSLQLYCKGTRDETNAMILIERLLIPVGWYKKLAAIVTAYVEKYIL